jgi:hypothetical protein
MSQTLLADVERLARELTRSEQLILLERLTGGSRDRRPRDLYGIYRDRVPADFDLDSALAEIRSAWQRPSGDE